MAPTTRARARPRASARAPSAVKATATVTRAAQRVEATATRRGRRCRAPRRVESGCDFEDDGAGDARAALGYLHGYGEYNEHRDGNEHDDGNEHRNERVDYGEAGEVSKMG